MFVIKDIENIVIWLHARSAELVGELTNTRTAIGSVTSVAARASSPPWLIRLDESFDLLRDERIAPFYATRPSKDTMIPRWHHPRYPMTVADSDGGR
jgi:hypothetical protein